jgi:hypothetical protein
VSPRKNRPVLLELVTSGERPQPRPAPRPITPSAERSRASEPVVVRPAPELFTGSAGAHPLARVVGGRTVLDLAWPHLVAVAVLLLVVLFATFRAGKRSAAPASPQATNLQSVLKGRPDSPAPEETPVPRPGPRPTGSRPVVTPRTATTEEPLAAAPPVPESKRPDRGEHAEREAGAAFAFRPGYSYVVVQHLSKRPVGVQAGEKIQEFLASKGIPVVVHAAAADLQVIATEAFLIKQNDSAAAKREKERATKLIEQVKKLGQEYNLIGQYSFDKCYLQP